MKLNTPSGWVDAIPKKINTPDGWKDAISMKVATPSGWKQVWPPAEQPLYLYDIEIIYLPNYEVSFKALKGLPPNEEEAFMFRCAEMPRDGYVAREFTKQWAANGYSKLNCTLADLYGDGNPENNAEMMKTISFTITPKP